MPRDAFALPAYYPDAMSVEYLGPQGLWAVAGSYSPHDHSPTDSPHVHLHARTEVGLVLSGEEVIFYKGHRAPCRAGDVWLCPGWEPHGFRYAQPNTAIVVLRFGPDFLGAESFDGIPWFALFSVAPALRPSVATADLRARVLEIGHSLRRQIRTRPRRWEAAVRADLLRLLAELTRHWAPGDAHPGRATPRPATISRIAPALRLAHAPLSRRPTVPQAAAACGFTVSGFEKAFRRAVGESFTTFAMRARLNSCADQLLHTDRTVAAIAAEAGFVDPSHLRRRFRQRFNCSPSQLRRAAGPPSRRPPPART